MPCSTSASARKATAQDRDYTLLYPLLDMATGLDPYYNIAYRFGAIFLSEPKPAGPGRPDLAVKLLRKGLEAQPTKWQYMQDIGFVHFWAMHDYKGAAEWFERGSRLPGAAWFLKPLAADDAGAGRPPQRVADAVPGARRVGRERLDPQGRGAPAAAARRDGRARRAAACRPDAIASAAARRR